MADSGNKSREMTQKTPKNKKKSQRYFTAEPAIEVHTPDLTQFHQSGGPGAKTQVTDLSRVDFTNKQKSTKRKQDKAKWKRQKEEKFKSLRREDPFPGEAPVPKAKKKKYKRGETLDTEGIKTKSRQKSFKRREEKIKTAVKQAARAELLLPEEAGLIEADEGEETGQITQHEIASSVDISSAQKYFELTLDKFGPYRLNYTRNGRFLLVGGRKGHIAAMDWQTKKLMCEMNVMETVQDIKWLHIETMFAVAQKQWTYIYDNQGIELHCLKVLDSVLRMEFLPYHFLLCTANARSYLSWLDISVGQKVAGFATGLGRLDVMCQNPSNAVVHLGHSGGTVTLWSPNVKEPLVKMLCHGGGTRSITVNHTGQYMATSGVDRTLKIWDLRTYKVLQSYKLGAGAGHLQFSQRGLLAAGIGNVVEVYNDCIRQPVDSAYLCHRLPATVQNLQFCPYEDVLGVGHGEGFSSLLIPGAGEPNFDALEANPFQSKKQRQQAEVKMLLEKVQPEMISIDTTALGKIDRKTLEEKLEEKKNFLYLKPQKVDFEPKYKKKGKSKTGRLENRKKGVRYENIRSQVVEHVRQVQSEAREKTVNEKRTATSEYSVFDRFKPAKER